MPGSLWPHRLQHARLSCLSPPPWVWSNLCSLSWWYHPTISSSVTHFSSCSQSFPSSGSFPVNGVFASGGQSIGVSASVLPMNIQMISLKIDWFDFLAVQGHLKSLFQYYNSKASILWHSAFFMVQLSHPYMTTGKTIDLTTQTLSAKRCLCFLIHCLGLSWASLVLRL